LLLFLTKAEAEANQQIMQDSNESARYPVLTLVGQFKLEMGMGHFFFAQHNPTHRLADPTQPNPSYHHMDPISSLQLLRVLSTCLESYFDKRRKIKQTRKNKTF